MNKLIATLCAMLGTHCGGTAREWEVGGTRIIAMDGAEAWEDFPETLRGLQSEAVLPVWLWDMTIYIYPSDQTLPEVPHAKCFYQTATGDIYIRPIGMTTFESCLAHELAHRFVALTIVDDDCTEEDVHLCPGWIERNDWLSYLTCTHSWGSFNEISCDSLPGAKLFRYPRGTIE